MMPRSLLLASPIAPWALVTRPIEEALDVLIQAEIVQSAVAKGIPVVGDIELFAQALSTQDSGLSRAAAAVLARIDRESAPQQPRPQQPQLRQWMVQSAVRR